MFKFIIFIIFLIGLCLIIYEITKITLKCPKQEIQYKYLPRNLDLDVYDSSDIDNIFKLMFRDSEPWIAPARIKSSNLRKINASDFDRSF